MKAIQKMPLQKFNNEIHHGIPSFMDVDKLVEIFKL
jgi:hypothetical protein